MSEKIVMASGKRKTAIARGIGYPGRGRVLINGKPLEIYEPRIARMKIMEPLLIAGNDLASKLDIEVNVKGGGFMGQAEAVRQVIAKILSEFGGETVKKKLMEYDRSMLVGDPRRTEPKKFGGYSARRKKQKSYR
ncbi:MAG: 30S ribosomal protein S9 [Candidatus Verstraetearchaeota archaeon]|jgi:small subunit ribosomal protein S9|nr:30S ribosomal protein S9 [Candidatus Verstraetearchaeota archaeon]